MSGTHPIAALKAAIRAHLLGDPALAALSGHIHDGAPRNSAMPFLTLGEGVMRENATNDAAGYVIELDLTVFTRERGSAEGLALANAIEARLEDGLVVEDWRLVLLVLRESLVLRYRAFIEAL